jgi:hypothetical protein
MHSREVREEVGVVTAEVLKECAIFIESQELTNYLDGEHFRVTERGSRSARSETPKVSDAVVDEAEDSYDEGALRSIRRRPPLCWLVWSLPSGRYRA